MAEHLLPTVPCTALRLRSALGSDPAPIWLLKLGGVCVCVVCVPGGTLCYLYRLIEVYTTKLWHAPPQHSCLLSFTAQIASLPCLSAWSGEDAGMGARPAPCAGTGQSNAAGLILLLLVAAQAL